MAKEITWRRITSIKINIMGGVVHLKIYVCMGSPVVGYMALLGNLVFADVMKKLNMGSPEIQCGCHVQ